MQQFSACEVESLTFSNCTYSHSQSAKSISSSINDSTETLPKRAYLSFFSLHITLGNLIGVSKSACLSPKTVIGYGKIKLLSKNRLTHYGIPNPFCSSVGIRLRFITRCHTAFVNAIERMILKYPVNPETYHPSAANRKEVVTKIIANTALTARES